MRTKRTKQANPDDLPPLPVNSINPEALYGLLDFARVFPARQGGRLTVATARNWAEQGLYGFFNAARPGCKHRHWVTYGRNILAAIATAEQTNPTAIPERPATQAERLRAARAAMQRYADNAGRTINSSQLNETFTPRTPGKESKPCDSARSS